MNYRPEYSHSWGSKTYYTQLRLDPLGKESAEEMLSALLGPSASLSSLKRLIIEKTRGNPFFMEETVQVLLDEGSLERDGAALKLTKPLAELKIPPTVQAILAARIDRLPARAKDLLQTLAVIGKEFPLSVVRAVIQKPDQSDDELDQMLGDLQLAEFIYEQPAVGDVEYVFKHALTQEVAYGSVLTERRRAIHERVGRAIEALFADRIEEHLTELAHHYRRTNDIVKAVHFLRRAGEQAAERSALFEAEGQVRDALGLLTAMPATADRDLLELGLQTTLASLLTGKSWGASEKEEPLRRAYELCGRVDHPREVLPALLQLGGFYSQQLRLTEAREVAERAVTVAQRLGDPLLESAAYSNLGETYFWSGDLPTAHVCFERAFDLLDHVSPQALTRSVGYRWMLIAAFLSVQNLILGRPEQVIAWGERIAERARSSSHPYRKAFGLMLAAWAGHIRGDLNVAARECLRACGTLCGEYGFAEVGGWIEHLEGWDRFCHGDRVAGMAEMKNAIERLDALGSRIMSTWRLVLLAAAQIELGDYQAADATVAEAFANVERTNERWCEPELHLVAAEAILRRSGVDLRPAEQRLRQAIEIARKQTAKWWELRATTSLARLLKETGRREEARATLADVYNWFSEGFDTADLRGAKALLEELGA